MIKKLCLIFFLSSFTILSQNNRELVKGTVRDSLGLIENINVINLNTSIGTNSNYKGEFEILAVTGDTIMISSIQHISKKIVVTRHIFKNNKLDVLLKFKTYLLEEIKLKNHELSGALGVDVKKVQINKIDSIVHANLDFSKVDFSLKDYRIDEIDRMKPPVVITNPTQRYQGLNFSGLLSLLKKRKTYKTKNKYKILTDEEFSDIIMIELGEDFFINKLKIPKEKYFHFLGYCKFYILKRLYKQNKILIIIKIF
ncbi:hypothetical protein, partial [Polaribacter porphyrae]